MWRAERSARSSTSFGFVNAESPPCWRRHTTVGSIRRDYSTQRLRHCSSSTRARSRILEGKHGIRRQPDITFAEFAKTFMKDHAELNKRSAERDRYILKVLNKAFGTVILHQITAHRIEQFKRERLAGKWRGKGTKRDKPIRPASVNRELDTLKSIFSKAVEWGKLLETPRPSGHASRHHDRRRHAAYVATHGTEPDDRYRVRRLHRDGNQRSFVLRACSRDTRIRAKSGRSQRSTCPPWAQTGHTEMKAIDRPLKKSRNC